MDINISNSIHSNIVGFAIGEREGKMGNAEST